MLITPIVQNSDLRYPLRQLDLRNWYCCKFDTSKGNNFLMINHLDRGYYGSVPAYEDKTQAYFDPLNETKT